MIINGEKKLNHTTKENLWYKALAMRWKIFSSTIVF